MWAKVWHVIEELERAEVAAKNRVN